MTKSCVETIEGIAEIRVILQRSGILANLSDINNIHICTNHRSLYGKDFDNITRKQSQCLFPDHSGKKAKGMKLAPVSFPNCEELLRRNILLPFGIKVCSFCPKKINERIDADAQHVAYTDLRQLKIGSDRNLEPLDNFDNALDLDVDHVEEEHQSDPGKLQYKPVLISV